MMEKLKQFVGTLFSKKFDPATEKLPQVDKINESNIKGLYIIGEVSGTPLIKSDLNQGYDLIDRLFGNGKRSNETDSNIYDVVIVGAGASGLGAASRAHDLGINYLVIEQGKPASTIRKFTKSKILFAEPLDEPLKSDLWFEECTREELLEVWDRQIKEKGLNINTYEMVKDINKGNGTFEVITDKGKYKSRHVMLAIGKAGNPRKAGVPGEKEYAEKIDHFLADADEFKGQDILVYGGGDVAAEAVLALCDSNKITMATIDEDLIFPRKRNVDALRQKQREGKLSIHLDTKLIEIKSDQVVLSSGGKNFDLKNDHVFEMIGAELPLKFFDRVGIKLEGQWDFNRVAWFAGWSAFIYLIYASTKWFFPFNLLSDQPIDIWGRGPGFWKSALYTVVMLAFGVEAMRRWWRDPHQRLRFVSLISFQVLFFFVIPELIVYYNTFDLGAFENAEGHNWMYNLWYAWPLAFYQFDQWVPGGFKIWGIILTFILIPIFVRKHGKRYCTWICGCGGLAETLGDRWRHLAPKGKKAAAWEFQNLIVLGLAAVITALVVVDIYGILSVKDSWKYSYYYSLFIDFGLTSVIPVSLYPIYGGKVWCRYWCPLAKYMQILSKWYGKLKIESNDKCITCGECSRYCQVGIDVMTFAKNQQEFSNQNTSCIQCGICITVCPMDVLSFSTDASKSDPKLIQIQQAA